MSVDAVIKHLSDDIINRYNNTIVFRTRIAFVIWIGPFIILSSFIVATKGNFTLDFKDWVVWVCIFIFVTCYLILGRFACGIEQGAWDRCDKYRELIFKIGKQDNLNDITPADYKDNLTWQLPTIYFWAFSVIMISFLSITLLATKLKTTAGDTKVQVKVEEPVKVEVMTVKKR